MSQKKIAFIINPISGKGKSSNLPFLLDRYLDKHKFEYKIYTSEYAGHMNTLAIEAMADGCKFIVAVGGDGSVNDIFPVLINTDAVLGIIPNGSGDGLARYLNIPLNPEKAIRLINETPIQKIDTAEINGHPFINIAGIGFDAKVANLFSKAEKRGFKTYAKITFKTYASYKEKKYQIRLDSGKKINTRALMVCFANSNQFGNNFYIAPQANIRDGLIDVCIVKKIPFWLLPFSFILTMRKKIDHSKYYKNYRTQHLWVKSRKKSVVNIDGEPIIMDAEMELTVNPLSINMICPKF